MNVMVNRWRGMMDQVDPAFMTADVILENEEEEAFLLVALEEGDYDLIEKSITRNSDGVETVRIKYRVYRHLDRIL